MDWLPSALVGLGLSAVAYFGLNSILHTISTRSGVPTGRVYVSGGRLLGPGSTAVSLTPTDKLWLGRAVLGETGGTDRRANAAVIWALAQNLMLIIGSRDSRPRFSSFTALIRAYAQPVNPSWAVAGEGKCILHPGSCTPARIARRAATASTLYADLPAATRETVGAFFNGTLANPVPGATDWHASHFEGATVQVGGNWFGVSPRRRLA